MDIGDIKGGVWCHGAWKAKSLCLQSPDYSTYGKASPPYKQIV